MPTIVDTPFAFAVLDVGQGLSQVGMRGSTSVVWDFGPASSHALWNGGYRRVGAPHIAAAVVSHCHEDHYGGLGLLDSTLDFTGLVLTSPQADTSLLRGQAGAWSERLRFGLVAQGDTLGLLPEVRVECLWPPRGIADTADEAHANRYSLVFLVTSNQSRALVASDIDTAAERQLCATYGWSLRAELLVVPNHGSSSALDRVYYGYVDPRVAVVSCGAANDYGHPSASFVDLCYDMGLQVLKTSDMGHVVATTSGYYWTVSVYGSADARAGF